MEITESNLIVKLKSVLYIYNNNYKEISFYDEKRPNKITIPRPLNENEFNILIEESIRFQEKQTNKEGSNYLNLLSNRILFYRDKYNLAFLTKREVKTIKFDTNDVYEFVVPQCLFIVKRGTYYLFLIKNKNDLNKSELYKVPFPNVDGSGKICFGNALNERSIMKINDAETLFNLYENSFFGSYFNNHFFSDEDKEKFNYLRLKGRPIMNKSNFHGKTKEILSKTFSF